MLFGALAAIHPATGLRRLEQTVADLAERHDPLAGGAAAIGYDVLTRRGQSALALSWLDQHLPAVTRAGPDALESLRLSLERLDQDPLLVEQIQMTVGHLAEAEPRST